MKDVDGHECDGNGRLDSYYDPKPTLPSAKPEVGTMEQIWSEWRASGPIWTRFGISDPKSAEIAQEFARFYAKSIAAKAAEKAVCDDLLYCVSEYVSNYGFNGPITHYSWDAKKAASIIQKCFDTEIEREQ